MPLVQNGARAWCRDVMWKKFWEKKVATGWYQNAVFGGRDGGMVEIFDTRDEWIIFFLVAVGPTRKHHAKVLKGTPNTGPRA